MNSNRIVFVVILAGCLFFAWILFKNKFIDETFTSVLKAGEAPLEVKRVLDLPDRTIAPGGPNPPAQAAPLESEEAVVYGQPRAKDPLYEDQESADMPDRLRHPERMFKAAAKPGSDYGDIAVDGGMAAYRGAVSRDAAQQFSPELAQNGGEIYGGIFANDIDVPNYSSI
jgi:hypothetical protein